jgi:hypothetical protein
VPLAGSFSWGFEVEVLLLFVFGLSCVRCYFSIPSPSSASKMEGYYITAFRSLFLTVLQSK